MKICLSILALFLGANAATAQTSEERHAQCLQWMLGGYPSGIEEVSCTDQFSLPSAFMFKCARAARVGFAHDAQRRACGLYLRKQAAQAEHGYLAQL